MLSKKFGFVCCRRDLSLTIPAGEFFGFLGPNGAGKTTTIKMMTGLFAPTSGSISINGFDISKNPIRGENFVRYIPDQPFSTTKLTGKENSSIYIGGIVQDPEGKADTDDDALIDQFEIGSWVNKRAEDYSQGMRSALPLPLLCS